jgi:cobalt-precorrin 5A hydrolase
VSIAIITLSEHGLRVAQTLLAALGKGDLYLHGQVSAPRDSLRFESVVAMSADVFSEYDQLVYIMPCGVVVRAIAPLVRNKHTDPAIVVVDVGGRWVTSLLSGHEGGANQLAIDVANVLDAEPIITTTTEADKTLIVGVGCRKGTEAKRIVAAIESAVAQAGARLEDVRLLASADVKRDEPGLIEASRRLGIPLRIVSSDAIRESTRQFTASDFVQDNVGLPAVAEPAALLAGRRTSLLLEKQTYHGITVALAKESCMWSE